MSESDTYESSESGSGSGLSTNAMAAIAVVVVLAAAGAAMYFLSPGPAAPQVQAPAPAPGDQNDQLPPDVSAPVMAPVFAPVPAPVSGGGVVGGGPAASSGLGVGAYVGIGVGVLVLVAGIAYLAKGKRAEGFRGKVRLGAEKFGTRARTFGEKYSPVGRYRAYIRGKKSAGRLARIDTEALAKDFKKYPFVLLFFMQYNNKQMEKIFKNCAKTGTFSTFQIPILMDKFSKIDSERSSSWFQRTFKNVPKADNLERAIKKFEAFVIYIQDTRGESDPEKAKNLAIRKIAEVLECPGNERYKSELKVGELPSVNVIKEVASAVADNWSGGIEVNKNAEEWPNTYKEPRDITEYNLKQLPGTLDTSKYKTKVKIIKKVLSKYGTKVSLWPVNFRDEIGVDSDEDELSLIKFILENADINYIINAKNSPERAQKQKERKERKDTSNYDPTWDALSPVLKSKYDPTWDA